MAVGRDELIEMEVRLRDFMTKELKRLGLQTQKTSRMARSSFLKMGKSAGRLALKFAGITTAVLGLGAGLGGLMALFGKVRQGMGEAVAFSKAMAEVGTISEGVAGNIEHFSDAVLDLSTAFGQSELKTAKALYQTISAGITDTTEAMTLVGEASRLAVGGFADINVVVDFLTGVLNAYGKEVSEVSHLNDVFFETVRLGKTTIPEMAKQMGAVMPIAASLGVTIEELSAMLATLTLGNIETSLATTYMRQALVAIIQPTEEAKTLMNEMGLRFDKATIEAEGFVGILHRMKDAFGEDIAALQKFFPNVRSFIPVLSLAGNQFEKFLEVSEALATVNQRRLSPTMQALEVAMMSAGSKLEVVGNAARQGFMQLGMGLIESLTGPISSVTQLQDVAFLVRDAIAGLKPVVEMFMGLLVSLFAVLTKGMSMVAEHLFETSTDARVFSQDMEGLSTVLLSASKSLSGGDVDLTSALADVSGYLRSNREELVLHALAVRKDSEAVGDMLEAFTDSKIISANRAGVRRMEFENRRVTENFKNTYIDQIPKIVLASSPRLRKALEEYDREYTGDRRRIFTKVTDVVEYLERDAKNTRGAVKSVIKQISNELDDNYTGLLTTWEDAQTRLGRTLESREVELMRMTTDEQFADDFAEKFAVESGQTELIGKSFQEMYDIYSRGGKESAEHFITAFGTFVEGNLGLIPQEVLPVALPKWEQLMVKLASMGGETWKNTFLGATLDAFTSDDVLAFDEDRMALIKNQLAVINKEYERYNLLLSDTTPEDALNKQVLLLNMKMEADILAAEIAVREGSRSRHELEQSTEAIRAAYSRMRSEVVGDTEKVGFAFEKLRRDAQDLTLEFEQIKVQAVNMLADGLAEGMMQVFESSKTADEAWKDFSRNFLRTIAIMIMRAYMLQAVMAALNIFGGGAGGDYYLPDTMVGAPTKPLANGGVVPGGLGRMMPVHGYANGGPIVSEPHVAVIGEGKHNEAVVPLPDGRSIPVNMSGGGTSVNISINAVDAAGVDELLVSRQDTLRTIIRQAMTESRSFRSSMLGQTRG